MIGKLLIKFQLCKLIVEIESYEMDNFYLNELMDLADAYVGLMIDAIYRRLIDRDFALENPEVVILLAALTNILGHANRGDCPTEVLLMAAYGQQRILDRPNMRVMR